MFSLQLRKHVKIVSVALATLALTAGSSSAAIINFDELPNGAGIHVTGDLDVTKLGSPETFRISAPNCTPNCMADATLNGIGTGTEYLVNILESAGGPISDQVHVFRLPTATAGAQVIDFISDGPFESAGAGAMVTTVVETGSLQPVLTYTSGTGTVSISVRSDVVPEPATLAFVAVGVGLLGIATTRRRKPAVPTP